MNFAIYGAGAIGAYLGAKLALAGEKVTLIARGAHFQAMQTNGVRVQSPEGDFEARPTISNDPTTIGPVDFLFLTVNKYCLLVDLTFQLLILINCFMNFVNSITCLIEQSVKSS